MNEDLSLAQSLEQEGVSAVNRSKLYRYLDILGTRDEPTRRHSIRVGVRSAEAAKVVIGKLSVNSKMMLWAGLLHDVGKALVDPDLFRSVGAFTEDDYRRMEPHVEYGWRLLREIHVYTAHIIVRHHRHGSRPYPAELPPLPDFLKRQEGSINDNGRLLALVDYYDAITTRENEKFGKLLAPLEKRAKFLEANVDVRDVIAALERKKVFVF